MQIEYKNNDQLTITIPSTIDKFGLQRVIKHLKYLEATIKSDVKQSEVDKLADEVNSEWWAKNKSRFAK